jgi:N-acetylglucosaminyldiphosphoundecaprenol N-acetyl-beta-D-mannosaminyltransferase
MAEPAPLPTCAVLGVPLAATDYPGAVAQAKAWAAQGGVHTIAATATHPIAAARRDPDFRKVLASLDLILPDGMPLIWVMNRRLAQPLADRVYGPTFMLRLLEATAGEAWSHFFLGGSEKMLAALDSRLRERFPSLRVAGTYSPPFKAWDEAEDERMLELIRASGANCIWIGLGSPKQERWLARMKPKLPPAVYIAVGAAFAFHAGLLSQAPAWMQKRGLEWLFRLASEPRRLWKRYLVSNSLFLWYLLFDRAAPGSKSLPHS